MSHTNLFEQPSLNREFITWPGVNMLFWNTGAFKYKIIINILYEIKQKP